MPKTVEVSEIVADLIGDSKQKLAKDGQIYVNKDDFVTSIDRHKRMNDERVISRKWKQLVQSGALEAVPDRKFYLLKISKVIEAFPEIKDAIISSLNEGERLNILRNTAPSEVPVEIGEGGCTHTYTYTHTQRKGAS